MNDTCDKHVEFAVQLERIEGKVNQIIAAQDTNDKSKSTWLCFAGKVFGGLLQGVAGGAFALLLWYLQAKP